MRISSTVWTLQGTATAQIAPVMFLYLQHPQKTLAAAAHSLFCAVLKHSQQVRQTLVNVRI